MTLFVDNVIPALVEYSDDGKKTALVTLVHIDGSSPRPLGSQVGVAEDGRAVGMITGGCAEKAIIAQAINTLKNRENKIIRYGEGSPFVDIVLPCGAGIDIYFETIMTEQIVRELNDSAKRRLPSIMGIDRNTLTSKIVRGTIEAANQEIFCKEYTPDYRLMIFGEGANLTALSLQAITAGFDICAYSPDKECLTYLENHNIKTHHIHHQFDYSTLEIDPYTAVITLFHDHEWELPILHAALKAPTNYIGALGSRRTHSQRLSALANLPGTHQLPDKIRGPVGVDIGAHNPNEIAISILAEIIAHRRQHSK